MTDQNITDQVTSIKNILDNLKSAALEPICELTVIRYSGLLSDKVGMFIQQCLEMSADKIAVDDHWETNR